MGLDMYLYAKLRMGKYCAEHLKETEELIRKGVPNMFKSGNFDTVEIKFEVGYWRKANQIHKWFVDNVQDGEDECIPHCVSRESLKKLREVCKQVTKLIESKKSKKEEELKDLLPTEEGFFFGSTDYDEWYMEDIKATIKIINKCLKLPKDWEFEYRSSW